MTIRAADATFEVNTFTWTNGAFQLTGTWQDAPSSAACRLLVDVGGRRKSLGAQGGRIAEDGPNWGARFICMTPPDDGGYAAMQVAGREIELPAPVVQRGGAATATAARAARRRAVRRHRAAAPRRHRAGPPPPPHRPPPRPPGHKWSAGPP